MKTFKTALLALAVTASLAGCNAGRDAANETGTTIADTVETNMQGAMDKARTKLATENISLDATGVPKAEITPRGDLLIGGQPVAVTPEQRAMLLEYRTHVTAVASAGMDVGVQGAKLATTAVREALGGVFSGKGDEVEKRIEAQAEPIRQAALKICDQLPGMLRTQQALAASLPAFAPYATMEASDIDDCRRDATDGNAPNAPEAPAAPEPPPAPVKGPGSEQQAVLRARDVIGKPTLPELPELPDPTG